MCDAMRFNCLTYPLTLSDDARIDNRTGQAVAIKVIDVESAEDEVEDIIQEIAILSNLNSQFMTRYYGSFLKGSDLWIVMEFCSGGSCGDLMKAGPLGEEFIAIIVKELLMGLEYLHADNKLHRDIKGTLQLFLFLFGCICRLMIPFPCFGANMPSSG
jgi:serine/threonine-protein kinase 24/25/MST4